ncbi:restriction endonuclease subunit S [Cylindrospermum sp. FACHB-282]|uniref:restriction endonuclease subunit S n=1 Tax=Cylindrospermum sp. FACHB-282 TaxID=2692794 RepID=UPI0016824CD0|nr:restriction endonuclease subunit S [Cylindrospermum sp. FACHB-282]MBD2384371.1 restriction endonuclease subunit S [Cylindrospermum sp. FACHB-282]
MSKWEQCNLSDLITLKRGYDLPNRERVHGKYPIISSSGISGFHKEAKVKAPGVVTGRYGTLGEVFYITKDFWPLNTSLYIQNFKGNNPRFISYFLKTLDFGSQNVAGAVPGVNRNSLHRLRIRKPPLPVQKKIAAILSAYDDLIENNNRRIAILEKMAEEIYREWFVRLRFPGHEQVKFNKGIPESWEIKQLGELVTTQYGYTASAEEKEVGPKFLRITDIVPNILDWDYVPYCTISDKEIKKYLLHEGDIVVARTGATVGYAKRIHKYHPNSVFASYLVRLKPNKLENSIFLGIAVESNNFKNFISMFFTGSAQPQANAQVMSLFSLLYPTEDLIRRFNKIVNPILDHKEILFLKNSSLKKTRDRLLTRLISGKLSVEDLDIQFPPSMTE